MVPKSFTAGERNDWAYRYFPSRIKVAEIGAKLNIKERTVYRLLEFLKGEKVISKCVFGLKSVKIFLRNDEPA